MEGAGYWAALNRLPHLGSRRFRVLLDAFGSAKGAWEASQQALRSVLGEIGEAVAGDRAGIDPDAEAAALEQAGIALLTVADEGYPEDLRNIADPPPVLYLRGRLPQGPAVAIVGSRRASAYGLEVSRLLARDLAAAGVVVASGLARGIDGAAHRGAIEGGGATVAVLGCGIDVVYPREHARLLEEVVAHGAVLSEFPPGTPPEPFHFPARNRIISGLCRGVVVVEGNERSGSLITAGLALEQGREVFAVPGSILQETSRAPHQLIRQGARLVESAADVLEELGIATPERAPHEPPAVSGEEGALLSLLGEVPRHIDEVAAGSQMAAPAAASLLLALELRGLVRQLPGKLFVRSAERLAR